MANVAKSKSKVSRKLNETHVQKPLSSNTMLIVGIIMIVARILLTLLPSHKIDMGGYNYWSHYLADKGFAGIYNTHLVYGPAYLYLLYISGKIASIFAVSDLTHEFLIKFWAVLFDFLGGWLIYHIGKQHGKPKLGFWVGIVYILNPAIFINSSIWGQFDSLLATILFGVVYCFSVKKQVTAVVLYMIAVLTKPQSIFLFPLVVYLFFFQDLEWRKVLPFFKKDFSKTELQSYFNRSYWLKVLIGAGAVIVTYVVLVIPAFEPNPADLASPLLWISDFFLWLPRLYFKYVNDYPYATANGFNLWTILGGQVVPDSEPFWGLTYAAWEKILLLAVWGFSIWAFIKNKKNTFSLYYIAYLLGFGFFMFYGRMHERYLVPALIFLGVCVLWDSYIWVSMIILSACVLVNQYYLYQLAKQDFYWLAKDDSLAMLIAVVSLVIFIYSIYYFYRHTPQKKYQKGYLRK
jgi:Gpi18-like mannosyltransferase